MRDPFGWPRGPFPARLGGFSPDGAPEPPTGYALVVDGNGNDLLDPNGRYLIYSEA